MDLHVTAEYPGDAAGGADFLSLAARRRVIDVGPDGGEVARDERIVVTSRLFAAEDIVQGRVCLSEQTIRALGALVDLVEPNAVRRLELERARLQARLDQSEAENLSLKQAIKGIEDSELIRMVYIAPDGTAWSSRASLNAHMAPKVTDPPATVAPLQET